MMVVRCKFKCISKTEQLHWDRSKNKYLYQYTFVPVTEGSEENRKFYEATPSGELKLGTTRLDSFVVGQDYFIDLSMVVEEDA